MSLRIKLMLALLLTGLAAVVLIGGLAYMRVYYKVDTLRREQAAENFHASVTAYLSKHGSWEAGAAAEPFRSFMRSRREQQGGAPAAALTPAPAPASAAESAPPASQPFERRGSSGGPDGPGGPRGPGGPDGLGGPRGPGGPDGLGGPRGPGGPDGLGGPRGPGGPDGGGGFRPRGPGDGPPPRERGAPPEERRAPPAGELALRQPSPATARGPREGPDGPPFHFILADQNYRVLLGAGSYRDGQPLPEEARADALPVVVDGRTLAYVSPQGVLTPSKQELEYLSAVRDALLLGAACATALALALGLLLGNSLSRSLSKLTEAVRAMHGGSLHQRVEVQGKDEVATLAAAFNQMSEQLATSHAELKASHATILKQADQLRELSVRDALTELYNRRHFDEQATTLFNQAMRHGRPLSVVIGDIDFFKRINDQFSHATGDAVLRQVSAILRGHMRLTDLVARYGGEEFVIAFPETGLPQAAALCDKLRGLIENFPWHQVHPDLKVTMSMGVCADLAAGTAEAMLQRADALLYQAKETGRNRVCFA